MAVSHLIYKSSFWSCYHLLLMMLVIIAAGSQVHADNQLSYSVNLNNISTNDGLSNNLVFSILQDSRGFIWIGTSNGLNRYDGYTIQSYFEEDDGLSSSVINELHEDPEGLLWIGTQDGLDVFDPVKDSVVKTFQYNPNKSNTIAGHKVTAITQTTDGNKWIGYDNGLINIFDGQNFKLVTNPANSEEISFSKIAEITESRQGKIWVATLQRGLFCFNKNGKLLKEFFKSKEQLVNDVWIDSSSTVWVAIEERGLFYKKPGKESFQQAHVNETFRQKGYSISTVSHFHPERHGRLWVMDNKSHQFMLYDPRDGSIENYTSALGAYSYSPIYSFFPDRSHNLWVSSQDGLFKLNISHKRFKTFLDQPYPLKNYKNRLSTRGMEQIAEDAILVSTYDGIYQLHPKAETSEKFEFPEGAFAEWPTGAPKQFIPYAIQKDARGDLWIASEGTGLIHYDRSTQRLTPFFENKSSSFKGKSYFFAISMLLGTSGKIWIGSYEGLYFYERGDSVIRTFKPANKEDFFPDAKVWCLHQDHENMLWVGTTDGLFKVHPDTGITHHYFDETREHVLSNNNILSMHQDGKDLLWLGTRGAGLVRLNPETNEWQVFDQDDGLFNNVIYSIQEQADSSLWLSSDFGLMEFNKSKHTIRTFLPDDGLSHHEFNHGSALKCHNGKLLFGGVNGINLVPNESVMSVEEQQPIRVTKLEKFDGEAGQLINETSSVVTSQKIVLHPADKFFRLSFTLTDFQNPSENRYKYKLQGHDQSWHYIGNQNHLRLNNLPYGSYQLKVKGANSNGEWSDKILSLDVTVLKPYYLKWWFISLMAVGIILIGMFLINVWIVRVRKAKLEALVDEKTQELQANLRELEISNKELEQYAYIVSHDLKSPLRTIASYSQMLEKKYQHQLDEKGKRLIQFIVGGVHKMNDIIHELLIFSQVGKEGKSFTLTDFNHVIQQVQSSLDKEIEENQAFFHVHPLPQLHVNSRYIEQLFLNLISNAIKYRKDDVEPVITISAKEETDRWLFSVSDNGPGINMDYHNKAFEPFQRLEHLERPGTGMGLAICKKVIDLHEGDIWFISQPAQGTTFYFTIPKKLRQKASAKQNTRTSEKQGQQH